MGVDPGETPKREGRAPLVVITGACGLIGQKVAQDLARDHRIVALDVVPPPSDFPDATFIECDLTSDESVERALARLVTVGTRIASVIHLAAYYDFSGEPSPLYDQLTVEGTRRLVRALRARFEVEQLVFSSSLLAMKPIEDPVDPAEALDERSPLRGEWDYPASKLEAERVLLAEHGDIPVVVLRLAGAYDEGGHSPPITQQIWRIRERKLESHMFPGDPEHGQSFVHLDDVARLFRAVVEHRGELGDEEVFLAGEPGATSYAELQDRIGRLIHGKEWTTLRIPAPLAKAGAAIKGAIGGDEFIKPWMVDLADAHYPVDIEKARTRLQWEPEHRLLDTLPEMIERLEADPRAWYAENDLPGADAQPEGDRA